MSPAAPPASGSGLDGPVAAPGAAPVTAPDALPPRVWVTALFGLMALTWVWAFSPSPTCS